MSNIQKRSFQLFDDEESTDTINPNYTFTPCTRLSRLMIHSSSTRNGRTRSYGDFDVPVRSISLNDQIYQAALEDCNEREEESHPKNLDYVMETRKIMMSKDLSDYEEEDESDEGDLLSSGLYPPYSPERDEPVFHKNVQQLLSDLDDPVEVELNCFDPTNSWLSCIYQDTSEDLPANTMSEQADYSVDEEEDENRPPRYWNDNMDNQEKKFKEQRAEEDRIPLREIQIEPESDTADDSRTIKKKVIFSAGKPRTMRIMRALSPPRYSSKRKEPSLNTHTPSTF